MYYVKYVGRYNRYIEANCQLAVSLKIAVKMISLLKTLGYSCWLNEA